MVKINDKYYISADFHCYCLKEKIIVKNEEIYKNIGYYSSLELLLNGLLKNQLREFLSTEEQNSVEDMKKFIKKQSDFIKSLDLKI